MVERTRNSNSTGFEKTDGVLNSALPDLKIQADPSLSAADASRTNAIHTPPSADFPSHAAAHDPAEAPVDQTLQPLTHLAGLDSSSGPVPHHGLDVHSLPEMSSHSAVDQFGPATGTVDAAASLTMRATSAVFSVGDTYAPSATTDSGTADLHATFAHMPGAHAPASEFHITPFGTSAPTGELWIADQDTDSSSANVIEHINSDGTGGTTVINEGSTGVDGGVVGMLDIALDTADNLYFAMGNDLNMQVGNITTGNVIASLQIGDPADGDIIDAIAVNPINHTIYVSLFGGDYASDGADIIEVTYNPSTGALTSPYNASTHSLNANGTNHILMDTTSSGFESAIGMDLSTNGNTLYYADDDDDEGFQGGYYTTATNGIYSVSTSGSVGGSNAPTPTLLSSQTQFAADGSDGFITGMAVDSAKGLIYFTTDDINSSGDIQFNVHTGQSQDALWYMPIGGGTATQVTGVSLSGTSYYGNAVSLDPDSQTLYIGDSGRGTVVQVVLGAGGTSGTPNYSFATLGTGEQANPTTYFDALPVLTVNGTSASAVQGGSAVTLLSSAATIAVDNADQIKSATITISNAQTGDELSISSGELSAAGLSATGNGTSNLTISGIASYATYQTVLGEITYQDTGTSGVATRTFDWSVSNGVTISDASGTGYNDATSTIQVDIPPTVTAGATATFDGGGSAVVLDSGLTISDAGGVLSSATITIGTGYIAGDTPNFTNTNSTTEGNISVSSDSGGVLVLTSAGNSATVAQWQAALDAVTYSFSPSNGDPTGGGSHTTRTIDWKVTDTVTGNSNTATSTVNTVHVAPTVTASGTVSYTAGGSAQVLDGSLTLADPDSSNMLSGATIKFAAGQYLTGDTLNFTTQNGISGTYSGGILTLTGSATVGNYQTALESITYTFSPTSGDPTNGGSENSRTIDWTVTDGVDTSTTATSTVNVAADVAPAVSSMTGSATSSANFSSGYTATFTLDVSKDVTVAGGTTISLSDGGTATYASGSGTTTLTFTYDATDAPQALTVTGISAGSIEDSAGKSLPISGTAISPYSDAVTDSAANVAANFGSLDSAVSYISSVTLNDIGTPNLDLTASEIVNDQTLIGKIVSAYNLVLDDSAAAIGSDFDQLETHVSSISAIVFTDSGTPTLDLTQTQVTNDASLLAKVPAPYDLYVTGVTGQAYSSYENFYNASDTLTIKIDFNNNSTESIYGYVSGLDLTGTSQPDTFYLQSAPHVTVTGGSGNDTFFFGSGFNSFDEITGGSGTNTLTLDGTYNGLAISTSMMSNIQTLHLDAGHSYNMTLDAGVLTTGEALTVQAAQLVAGNSLTLDASAITGGTLIISGGAGADDLTGGGGTNVFVMGANLTAADELNGGSGVTTVSLNGDYSGGLIFTATTMVNVQTLELTGNYSYDLTMNAATVANGQTLTVQGSSLGAGDSMTFNGSDVTDGGAFVIRGGAGDNNLTGGSGNDTIYTGNGTDFVTGGGGADRLIAGTGTDTFAYNAVSDSTSTTHDTISGFNTSGDMIALGGGLTVPIVIDTAVTTGNLSNTNFDRALANDIGASQLSAHGAVLFTPSTGGLAGNTFLIIDENGVAGYQTGQDLVIELTHGVNLASLSVSNFELNT